MSSSRRQFMSVLAGGVVVGGAGLWSSSPWAAPKPSRSPQASGRVKTVVWVELKGGNDGLNMLAPIHDAVYRRARPALALGADDVDNPTGGAK